MISYLILDIFLIDLFTHRWYLSGPETREIGSSRACVCVCVCVRERERERERERD